MPQQIYNPFSFVQAGWRSRQLIARLVRRRVEARYRGSILGLMWILIHPLLMLIVYTFVFSVVFRARWDMPGGGKAEFALFLFAGLIQYTIFAECANEAPTLMASNQTYIKQVVFPVEVLAWVTLLAALWNFSASLMLLLVFQVAILGWPPLTALYLPVVMAPLVLFTVGAIWLLSSLGVFLKDLSQIVGVLTLALLFLSPIFYSASRIPEAFRPYYSANPMAQVLEMSRGSLFYGVAPNWGSFAILSIGGWLFAWFSYIWFMRTKGSFADVL